MVRGSVAPRPDAFGCSDITCASSVSNRTGGRSAALAAACSASRSTAAPGTLRQAALGPELAATALARRFADAGGSRERLELLATMTGALA